MVVLPEISDLFKYKTFFEKKPEISNFYAVRNAVSGLK